MGESSVTAGCSFATLDYRRAEAIKPDIAGTCRIPSYNCEHLGTQFLPLATKSNLAMDHQHPAKEKPRSIGCSMFEFQRLYLWTLKLSPASTWNINIQNSKLRPASCSVPTFYQHQYLPDLLKSILDISFFAPTKMSEPHLHSTPPICPHDLNISQKTKPSRRINAASNWSIALVNKTPNLLISCAIGLGTHTFPHEPLTSICAATKHVAFQKFYTPNPI